MQLTMGVAYPSYLKCVTNIHNRLIVSKYVLTTDSFLFMMKGKVMKLHFNSIQNLKLVKQK